MFTYLAGLSAYIRTTYSVGAKTGGLGTRLAFALSYYMFAYMFLFLSTRTPFLLRSTPTAFLLTVSHNTMGEKKENGRMHRRSRKTGGHRPSG